MLKVAVAAVGPSLDEAVPLLFEDTAYLLIIDAETDAVLHAIESITDEPLARSLFFAQQVVDNDCEALLCGELEPEPFTVLAVDNCVTRYLAAGFGVRDSIHKMNAYELPLITDFLGGTGCPEADPANCALDHDHDHDQADGHDHGEEHGHG